MDQVIPVCSIFIFILESFFVLFFCLCAHIKKFIYKAEIVIITEKCNTMVFCLAPKSFESTLHYETFSLQIQTQFQFLMAILSVVIWAIQNREHEQCVLVFSYITHILNLLIVIWLHFKLLLISSWVTLDSSPLTLLCQYSVSKFTHLTYGKHPCDSLLSYFPECACIFKLQIIECTLVT